MKCSLQIEEVLYSRINYSKHLHINCLQRCQEKYKMIAMSCKQKSMVSSQTRGGVMPHEMQLPFGSGWAASNVLSIYLVKFLSKDNSLAIVPNYLQANGYGFCSTFLAQKRHQNIHRPRKRQMFLFTISFNLNILHRKTTETGWHIPCLTMCLTFIDHLVLICIVISLCAINVKQVLTLFDIWLQFITFP